MQFIIIGDMFCIPKWFYLNVRVTKLLIKFIYGYKVNDIMYYNFYNNSVNWARASIEHVHSISIFMKSILF